MEEIEPDLEASLAAVVELTEFKLLFAELTVLAVVALVEVALAAAVLGAIPAVEAMLLIGVAVPEPPVILK